MSECKMLVTMKGLVDNKEYIQETGWKEKTDNEKLDLLKSISFTPENCDKCKLHKYVSKKVIQYWDKDIYSRILLGHKKGIEIGSL